MRSRLNAVSESFVELQFWRYTMKTAYALAFLLMMSGVPMAWAQEAQPAAGTAQGEWTWLAPFTDQSTLGTVVVDVERFDVAQLATLLIESANPPMAEVDAKELTTSMSKWMETLRAAGAKELVFVASLKDVSQAPAYVVIKGRAGIDMQELRAAVERPVAQGGLGGFGLNRPVTVEHGCVLIASAAQRQGLGGSTRAEALRAAMERGGNGAVRVGVFPESFATRAITELMPRLPEVVGGGETREFFEAWTSMGASIELKPAPAVSVGFTARDEEAAAAFAASLNDRMKLAPAAFVGGTKAVHRGNVVTVNMDPAAVRMGMGTVASEVIKARRVAAITVTLVRARNVVMGCWMHAQANADKFPDSLDQLAAGKYVERDQWQSAEGTAYFVYVKPGADAMKGDASRVVVLYERHTSWPAQGIAVGFLDGHAQVIASESEFKELLKGADGAK